LLHGASWLYFTGCSASSHSKAEEIQAQKPAYQHLSKTDSIELSQTDSQQAEQHINSKKSVQESSEDNNESTSTVVELTREQYNLAGIALGRIEQRTLAGVLRANGIIDVPPQNLATISPRMGGFIKTTIVHEGLRVRKGQVLATLEHPDFIMLQQEYLDNLNKLAIAERDFQRQEYLSKEQANAGRVVELSELEMKNLRNRTAALNERLAMMGVNTKLLRERGIRSSYPLLSPMNGFITVVRANVGKFIAAGEMLCEIVNTDHVHASLTVFEKDLPFIREGQRVKVQMAFEAQERAASVFLVGKEIAPDRTAQVHLHFDKPDVRLLPRMTLIGMIELSARSVLAVPEQAIVNHEGKEYIFLAHTTRDSSSYTFTMVGIQRGVREQGWVELYTTTQPLWAGTQIVTQGAYTLLSALKNTPEEE
jgi:RND family efflux transporter MFP subunit